MGKGVYTMLFCFVMVSGIAVATLPVTAAETVYHSKKQQLYSHIRLSDGFYDDYLYRYGHMSVLTSLLLHDSDDFDLNESNIMVEEAHRFQASSMEAHNKREADAFLTIKEAFTPIHLNW